MRASYAESRRNEKARYRIATISVDWASSGLVHRHTVDVGRHHRGRGDVLDRARERVALEYGEVGEPAGLDDPALVEMRHPRRSGGVRGERRGQVQPLVRQEGGDVRAVLGQPPVDRDVE